MNIRPIARYTDAPDSTEPHGAFAVPIWPLRAVKSFPFPFGPSQVSATWTGPGLLDGSSSLSRAETEFSWIMHFKIPPTYFHSLNILYLSFLYPHLIIPDGHTYRQTDEETSAAPHVDPNVLAAP